MSNSIQMQMNNQPKAHDTGCPDSSDQGGVGCLSVRLRSAEPMKPSSKKPEVKRRVTMSFRELVHRLTQSDSKKAEHSIANATQKKIAAKDHHI